MSIENNNKAFAEVIESSLTLWKSQAWQWDSFPQFGSLVCVKVNDYVVYGIIHQIQMGSQDPHRTVFAYKKTEQELQREQPQIFEFLQTTFECLILGYKNKNSIVYQLAPEPPKIHSFVYPASQEEIIEFFSNQQYLHILFNFSSYVFSLDELLLSLLKNLSKHNALNNDNIEKFIETFSLLTGNDYRRLKLFLQRATPLISL